MKGRAAHSNPSNKFLSTQYDQVHWEGLDEPSFLSDKTTFIHAHPKTIVNKVPSPDIPMDYSINPYQGCEHGCTYCYARNSHEYWGYGSGIDFETKIIVKSSAPQLLATHFQKKKYIPSPIMLSGNTDCYQPAEKKFQITRQILKVMEDFKHPVGIITKNAMVLRDKDILSRLAENGLAQVNFSINSLNEEIRSALEPRTSTAKNRLKAIEGLASAGVPVNALIAPVIPGLTDYEIPSLIEAVANAGAQSVSFITVRLNGSIGEIFEAWAQRSFPERAQKIMNQIKSYHGGKVNNSDYGSRMKGQGQFAEAMSQQFKIHKAKWFEGRVIQPLRTDLFKRAPKGQIQLFE